MWGQDEIGKKIIFLVYSLKEQEIMAKLVSEEANTFIHFATHNL